MSEKLFFRLYWRPYVLLGVSVLLVLIGSLAPYILPYAWLEQHVPGYYFYLVKTVTWMVKLSMLIAIISLARAMTADYFPTLEKLCTEKANGTISGYKKTWDRGSQLRPIIDFKVQHQDYSCAINEAKGRRTKNEDIIDSGFTAGLKKKLMYNAQNPQLFYLPGEEIYSRKAAVLRYILLWIMFVLELYIGFLRYMLG